MGCPVRAARRAARLSRPSLVIFSLPSVAGGSGTSEELQCRGVRPLLRFRAVVSVFLPFRCLRASAGLLNVGIGCYDTELVARRCSYVVRRRRGRASSSWYSWVVSYLRVHSSARGNVHVWAVTIRG